MIDERTQVDRTRADHHRLSQSTLTECNCFENIFGFNYCRRIASTDVQYQNGAFPR